MLRILKTQKKYNQEPVLDIPLLQLEKGIYWLQGINGSGKTTLLRMIAGLTPFEGEIFINDISSRKSPVLYRREVSWADAEPLYPAFITGRELADFYCDVRKAPAGQLDELIDCFGVHSYLTNPIGSYSSGMVKRLSLLLSLVGRPSLILLDEPLATLDVEVARLLPEIMEERRRELSTSFIFSSHQAFPHDALTLDRKLLVASRTIQFVD
ncbi:MAG: ABC transporter ATP-binding protein [Chitinophagaceae bacterium]|nr:ABC transporter ATP-binding protein [Chitinophagaceae bacterium]